MLLTCSWWRLTCTELWQSVITWWLSVASVRRAALLFNCLSMSLLVINGRTSLISLWQMVSCYIHWRSVCVCGTSQANYCRSFCFHLLSYYLLYLKLNLVFVVCSLSRFMTVSSNIPTSNCLFSNLQKVIYHLYPFSSTSFPPAFCRAERDDLCTNKHYQNVTLRLFLLTFWQWLLLSAEWSW